MAATPIHLDPDPLAPYRISPGYVVNGMAYLSGHAAISESGELVGVGDFDAQAEATFQSLERTLQAAGSDLSKRRLLNCEVSGSPSPTRRTPSSK